MHGCNRFHAAKGIVALKADFASDLIIQNVIINNIVNSADRTAPACRNPDNDPAIFATNSDGGGDVRGIALAKSYNVLLKNVAIDNLGSREGKAIALDIHGDNTGVALVERKLILSTDMDNVRVGSSIVGSQIGSGLPVQVDTTSPLRFGGLQTLEGSQTQVRRERGSTSPVV